MSGMKVWELIERLREMPPDDMVYVSYSGDNAEVVRSCAIRQIGGKTLGYGPVPLLETMRKN